MSTSDRDTTIPGLPFDPRVVGPLDLAVAAGSSARAWIGEYSRELLAAGTAVLVAQIVVYAWKDVVFLGLPTLPNWLLVGLGGLLFVGLYAPLAGVFLAKGLYRPDTVMISEQSGITGDQRIEHVATDVFENLTVMNQNGEKRDREYLQEVFINGRKAYEVDTLDLDEGVVVASSMAGRTNREIRADRKAIIKIKTDLEARADEAEELIINFRDLVRQQAKSVTNRILRTAQGVEVPDGENLHDELNESLRDVDPLDDLHSDTVNRDRDDDDRDDEASLDPDEGTVSEDLIGIFGRAAQEASENGQGGAPADD